MFCIKSDVITLEFIKMYGFILMSMDVWARRCHFYSCIGSHDMRHIGFHRLTVVNGTPKIGASQM